MRPTNMSRARLTAGATAVCATLVVVPTTGAADVAPTTAPTDATLVAAVKPKPKKVRKRTQASVWVQHVGRNVMVGRPAAVRGKLQPGLKGHVVRLQVRGQQGWTTVDKALTRAGGRFALSYKGQRPGVATVRVLFRGDRTALRARRTAGRVNHFRQAHASWYALYGNQVACGGTLGYHTLGVAHKTLPCGTKVTLRYRGRSVRVPVIDRGPFIAGRDYDLTGATKRALGFGDLGTVLVTK